MELGAFGSTCQRPQLEFNVVRHVVEAVECGADPRFVKAWLRKP
jgi:hypothetical protein